MIEIRIHGRGGQGGVTLAKILAAARFLAGDSVQAFGLYAAERSGAPIQAFCRYDRRPIVDRNLIYEPDHVVVLDATLVGPGIAEGLRAGGWILVNAPNGPEGLAERFPGFRVATVDATGIARRHGLGTRSVPIVNTALAGAAARVLDQDLDLVIEALEHLEFGAANQEAARQAFREARPGTAPRARPEPSGARPPTRRPPAPGLLAGGGGQAPSLRTGLWAVEQPRRQEMVPPCNSVCPAGNDVRGFLQALGRDDVDGALAILLRTTPFPSICGRVCPAPCMDRCNRIGLDGAVNVRQLERYAGDHGRAPSEVSAPRPEGVAIVGSGPAGLAAAYHLARRGYRVTVLEGKDEAGGLLRTGIPGYRLPQDVLDRELARVSGLGVEIRTGQRIDRQGLLELARSHDAVLVASGLQETRGLRLGLAEAEAVEQGIDFLDRARRGGVRLAGEDLIVVGGGNTAVDAARSALRFGARSVRIVYRRTRAEMPAIADEIDQALEEGVALDVLTLPVALRRDGADGGPRGGYRLTCRHIELGEPDDSGRPRPIEIPGSEHELDCHRLILALGQSPDLTVFPEGAEVRDDGRLLGVLETPVFAVGDLATGEGTVAGAIGSGRRAALQIDEMLSGGVASEAAEAPAGAGGVDVRHQAVILPAAMKLHLFERRPPSFGAVLPAAERRSTFDEIQSGLADPRDARRCLSCGVCDECDRCVTYCPEGVLKRVGHEFVFDYTFCKGCGVCAAECPRNVVFMSHL